MNFVRMHLKINVSTLNVQILFGSQTQSNGVKQMVQVLPSAWLSSHYYSCNGRGGHPTLLKINLKWEKVSPIVYIYSLDPTMFKYQVELRSHLPDLIATTTLKVAANLINEYHEPSLFIN